MGSVTVEMWASVIEVPPIKEGVVMVRQRFFIVEAIAEYDNTDGNKFFDSESTYFAVLFIALGRHS